MAKAKQKQAYTFRKLMNDLHLWVGLISSIILFLVCLSGTILTYEHELKSLFQPTKKIQIENGEPQSIAALSTIVVEEFPGTITYVKLPKNKEKAYEFTIKEDPTKRGGKTILVNPYNATIQELTETPIDGFLFTMFKLHRWLLLDTKIGRPIVGVATICFVFLSLSGIILWFPKKLKWKWSRFKPGFTIKTKANWKRINHDLHNTLGFYACIFLLIMALTGLCWSFGWYKDGLSNVLNAQVFGSRNQEMPVTIASDKAISVDDIVSLLKSNYKTKGDIGISLPGKRFEGFSTYLYHSGLNTSAYDQILFSDQGKVLEEHFYADKSFNQKIADAIRPIHTGEIFAGISKFIYFLACLIATSLPITGTLIWINKMKKK